MRYPTHPGLIVPVIGPQPLFKNFAIGSLPYRFMNEVLKLVIPNLFYVDRFREILPEDAQYAVDRFGDGIFVGGGIFGMNEVEPIMPNIVNFFPLTWLSSKRNTHKVEILEQDYTDFMNKFEHVLLVSFGTTFVPSN